MWPRFAADAVLLLHLAFIAFALFGALLALRWPQVLWLHVPAFCWGVYVEMSGRLCPLTGIENHFRVLAGEGGYSESFVDRYLLPVIYPAGLTRDIQFVLAAIVVLTNVVCYGVVFWRLRSRRRVGVPPR